MSRSQFTAILIVGALLRLAALPGPGTGDVSVWKVWSYNAARHRVAEMYGTASPPERRVLEYAGTESMADYPPLALYELGVAGQAYWQVSHHRFPNSAALNAVVKLPSLAGEVGLVLLLFFVVRRHVGPTAARWTAVAYWLNPAALIDASVLGYLDAQYMLPAVAAIVAAAHSWPALAGALIAAAMLTKAQALFIAPAVGLAVWTSGASDRRLSRVAAAAAAAVAVVVAVVAPIAAAGGLPSMLLALSRLVHHDMISANACNLWWIADYALRVRYSTHDIGVWAALTAPVRILGIPRVVELGYPNPRPIGIILTAGSAVWALWTARRTHEMWLLAGVAAFLVHAYATLSAQVHENHLFAAVPLLIVAAAGRRVFRPICAVVSAVVALNLNLFYGFGDGVGSALPRAATIVDATVVVALVNCAALAWHASVLKTECAGAAARLPRPAPE